VNATRAEKLILSTQINVWDDPVSYYVEASMAVHEQLQMQETDFYGDRTFKPMPRWWKCTNVLRNCSEIQILQWNK